MTDAYRVLYVDDEPSLLEITRAFLEREGDFAVDTRTSASEALRLLETRQYDAIVADYQMPEMDGITFLKQLRASGNTTPFIVYTGRGREEVVIEAFNNGADFYIQKGGDAKSQFAELSKKIRYAITKRRAENALAESEEKFRTIFENSPYPISINSIPDGKFIAVNAAFLQSSGYREDEVLGKTPIEMGLLSLLDFGRLSSHLLLSGSLENVPMVLLGKGGKPVHVQFSTLPVTISNRSAILTVTVEVTRLKRAEEELHQKNQELAAAFEELTASEEELRQNYDQLAAFQKTIQDSEARFRTLFALSPEGIILFDLSGRITFASAEALRMFRVPSMDEAAGTSVFDWVGPEHHELVRVMIGQLLDGKFRHALTFRVRRRDGSSFFVESSQGIFPDADGHPEGFIVIIRDITDRQQAEFALRESEERLRLFIQQAPAALAMFDREMRYLAASRRWIADYYLGNRDIIGRSHYEIFPEISEELKAVHRRSLAGEVLSADEEKFERQDGSVQWLAWEVRPWYTTGNSIGGIILYSEDITERKKAEEALRESEEKFRSIIEQANDGIVLVDDEGLIRVWNRSLQQITGLGEEEVIGKSLYDVQFRLAPEKIRKTPGAYDHVRDTVVSLLRSGEFPWVNQPLEQELRRPDGKTRVIQTLAFFIKNNKRKLICGFIRDVTDSKLAEEALRQANKKLNLLSGITRHDISNQLLALNGFLEVLHSKTPDPALEEYYARVAEASTRISAMIEFTKECEKIGIDAPVWHDCRALVDTASIEAPLGKVAVNNEIPAGIEIFADPLVTRVFYNLMDNAVRYGGKITTIWFSVQEQDGDQLIVCEDDGEGVPAGDKERIFARGFGKHTGLGLALSREILDITGITIRETGEPGRGARFEIMVPKGAHRITREQ